MDKNRVKPHILLNEALCPCGCGMMPSDGHLDAINELISRFGQPIKINIMARCPIYNKKIGGVEDSPHLENIDDLGASDIRCWNPKKRWKLILILADMINEGYFNQIEVCNAHLHIATVKSTHRLFNECNWGKSK
jgi:hypothetical protein